MSLEGLGGHTPEIRASDAEREYVVDVLRAQCTEGRIDLDEFSERINRVYAARTIGELNDICADLPIPATPTEPVRAERAPGTARKWIVAVMSGAVRKGRWRVDPETNLVAVMGGVNIDLRDAAISSDEIVLRCYAFMGGIDIIVPEGIEVHASGVPFMGGFDDKTNTDVAPLPGSPIVKIKYFAMMGGITIRSKASPQEEAKRKSERRAERHARRQASRGVYDARGDARRDVHEAIQQAKLEAIQQAREATKRALAAIPEWLGPEAPPPEGPGAGAPRPAHGTFVTLVVVDVASSGCRQADRERQPRARGHRDAARHRHRGFDLDDRGARRHPVDARAQPAQRARAQVRDGPRRDRAQEPGRRVPARVPLGAQGAAVRRVAAAVVPRGRPAGAHGAAHRRGDPRRRRPLRPQRHPRQPHLRGGAWRRDPRVVAHQGAHRLERRSRLQRQPRGRVEGAQRHVPRLVARLEVI